MSNGILAPKLAEDDRSHRSGTVSDPQLVHDVRIQAARSVGATREYSRYSNISWLMSLVKKSRSVRRGWSVPPQEGSRRGWPVRNAVINRIEIDHPVDALVVADFFLVKRMMTKQVRE
jgi:hypothetical protein